MVAATYKSAANPAVVHVPRSVATESVNGAVAGTGAFCGPAKVWEVPRVMENEKRPKLAGCVAVKGTVTVSVLFPP